MKIPKLIGLKNFVSKGNPKTKDIYSNTKVTTPKKAACFTGDTLVKTEDGLKPISEIKVGEKVQAVSDEDVYTDSELKEVTNVIISITDVLIKVTVDEEEIKTTETHPWYVEGKGFINAEYIEAGDKVRTDSGDVKVVEKVEKEKLPIKIVVINLTVKDNRTYFVGENEILVHNTCKIDTSSKMEDKVVPNPNGKKGGIPHQNKINEIASDIEERGLTPAFEYKYDTSGGYKNNRYADVVGLDSQGRVAEIHQVGRSTKKYGSPVSREKKAIRDIRGSKDYNGARIKYHPYDK